MVDSSQQQALAAAKLEIASLQQQVAELGQQLAASTAAHQETQRLHHLLDAIIEHLPHMLIVKDAETLRFLRFNAAGEHVLGFSRDDLIGKSDHDFFPAAEADFFAAKDYEVLRSGTLLDIPEETLQTRYHGSRLLHTKKVPILNAAGQPEFLLVISEDITEQKQVEVELQQAHATLEQRVVEQTMALRNNEAQLRAILANVPIIIYALDRDGLFTVSDGKGLAILGLQANQVVGMSVFDLYRDIPDTLAELRAVLAGEERMWLSRIGELDFNNHAMPLYDDNGQLNGLIGIASDITEHRRAEIEQARLQAEIIGIQQAALLELSTPMIPLNDQITVMPLVGAVDSRRAQQVLETLLEGAARTSARYAILDITGVSVVDTQVANALIRAAQAVQLLGTQMVLTGIRPEVAQTLVGLGVNLGSIVTHGTLQSGIAYAMSRDSRPLRTRFN